MIVKEKLDNPPVFGSMAGLYCLPSMDWDGKRFPTTYRVNQPVGAIRPSLSEYLGEALGKLNASIDVPTFAGVSRIAYERSRHRFNYCYHTSNLAVSLPYSYLLENVGTPGYMYVVPFSRFGFAKGTIRSPLAFVPDADRSARSSRAWWTMQPKFEGYISGLNFLLELKDFKRTLRTLQSLLNGHISFAIKSVRGEYWKTKQALQSGKAVTGAAANAWLSVMLNWKPLLSDVGDIIKNLLTQVEAAQKLFAAKGEYGNVSHYSENLSVIDERRSSNGNTVDVFSVGRFRTNKFTATLDMKYHYDLRSDMSAFLKFWGLTGSISTLWEATRLSFVVDYFIKIGKAIKAMELDENVKDVKVVKYCESYKSQDSSGLYFHASATPRLKEAFISGVPFQGTPLIAGYKASAYLREPCAPNRGMYIPQLRLPNTKQATTLLALTRSMMG